MFDHHLTSLLPDTERSRREFVLTSLAAGFALAVQPISAQTISTDTKGITADEVKVPAADIEFPAYRTMPEQGKRFPVVIVIPEIFGVHEHIKDVCRRLAKVGYMAIAPELFARQGDVSKLENIGEVISKVVSKVPDAQALSDLTRCVDYAAATGRGDLKRVAVTGFCWGGRMTWLFAAHEPRVKAAAAWYGSLVANPRNNPDFKPDPLRPKFPIDFAPTLATPVLGLYGGKDQGIPLETVEHMREALAKGKSGSKIIVYPDAPHGFHADYRPSYRKDEAQAAWQEMLAWFKAHGVA
ncbi:MAG: dienelactone hydrolase family protein [Chloracidobacterium sp.]|uniref:Dienelactone hydrolase family protein n=1 Tax=Chloracidobacterium validum TaxID=2821543 RepID=A0ABX8BFI5_9BACT|nr:dienelactone hydrolase family protein [Chloracidobacterium validum]QUW04675.1 dienelactone hydrolase family protein [Chloracidobacterium validum]